MKAGINKIFSLLLTLFFLVSTTGIVLASHICLAASEKTISLFENKGCCSEQENSCSVPVQNGDRMTSKCCVTDFSFHKVDASSMVVIPVNKNIVAICFIVIPQNNGFISSEYSLNIFSVDDPPLPFSGRQLLVSIHRLLV